MKTTNFCYILLTSALLFSSSLFAQEKPQRGKRLTPEQRIEHQVEKMDKQLLLDDETSAKFLPLYKEYLTALAECRQDMPAPKGAREKELNDDELDKFMLSRFECRKKCLEVQETYYKKFKEILTMRQVEKVFCFRPNPKPHHRISPEKLPIKAPLPAEKLIR